MDYVVIIEKGQTGYGAYLPDLPGCVAAADTIEEVRELIREAAALHLEDMRHRGIAVPPPVSLTDVVRVA